MDEIRVLIDRLGNTTYKHGFFSAVDNPDEVERRLKDHNRESAQILTAELIAAIEARIAPESVPEHGHDWWVFARELGTYDITRPMLGTTLCIGHRHQQLLLVECHCGAFGTVDDPTDTEWHMQPILKRFQLQGSPDRVTVREAREF